MSDYFLVKELRRRAWREDFTILMFQHVHISILNANIGYLSRGIWANVMGFYFYFFYNFF